MLPQQPENRNNIAGSQDLEDVQALRQLTTAQLNRQQRVSAKCDEQSIPFWAEPLPLPPEVDAVAIVQEDLKFTTLLAAVSKIAEQNGVSVASQLDSWNYGRG